MVGARQALQAANRKDLDGWFFSSDGQLQGLEAVVEGFDVASSQFSPLYGEAGLQSAIAVTQGAKLAPYYWLDLKTFTCLTDDECNKTKEYIAQLKATGMQF
jgi:ABC-type sugar transport system substrate-binding protein